MEVATTFWGSLQKEGTGNTFTLLSFGPRSKCVKHNVSVTEALCIHFHFGIWDAGFFVITDQIRRRIFTLFFRDKLLKNTGFITYNQSWHPTKPYVYNLTNTGLWENISSLYDVYSGLCNLLLLSIFVLFANFPIIHLNKQLFL